MRATMVAAILVVCGSLVACGTSAHEKKQQARKPAQQVADAVEALQHDLSTRNYQDLCERVFSSQARKQEGGVSCPTFVARQSQGVRDPVIEIKSIQVSGHTATASVVTSSAGEARAAESIELVWENGGFRVSALALGSR
jgi:hypothetical protein